MHFLCMYVQQKFDCCLVGVQITIIARGDGRLLREQMVAIVCCISDGQAEAFEFHWTRRSMAVIRHGRHHGRWPSSDRFAPSTFTYTTVLVVNGLDIDQSLCNEQVV